MKKQVAWERRFLPRSVREALAEAAIAYRESVEKALETVDNKSLLKFAGEVSTEDVHRIFDRVLTERVIATEIVAKRWHAERAKPILGQGGRYCVFHACEVGKCPQGSHDDP